MIPWPLQPLTVPPCLTVSPTSALKHSHFIRVSSEWFLTRSTEWCYYSDHWSKICLTRLIPLFTQVRRRDKRWCRRIYQRAHELNWEKAYFHFHPPSIDQDWSNRMRRTTHHSYKVTPTSRSIYSKNRVVRAMTKTPWEFL